MNEPDRIIAVRKESPLIIGFCGMLMVVYGVERIGGYHYGKRSYKI